MQKTALYILWIFLFSFSAQINFAQPGKDGSKTISTAGVVYNRYDNVTISVSAGANAVTVSNIANLAGGAPGVNNPYATSALSYGDLIMVIKMQGATINTTNTSSYGSITSLNNVGTYELAVVRGVTTNTITICGTFSNAYTVSATQRVQVIRIPRLSGLTINVASSLTANAWNGTTGGVVAIEVTGNIAVNGTITASGLGYRGGALDNNANLPGNSNYISTVSADGAEKGEGVAGYQTDYDGLGGRYNKGAPANGGGGGNAHNGGGGGGANAGTIASWNGSGNPDNSGGGWSTAWNLESASFSSNTSTGGGRGGYTYGANDQNAQTTGPNNALWGGDNRQNNGGLGGRPLTYSSNTLFLGGGGGAGDANNTSGGAGGNGGGIVYLLATGNLSGTGTITADGSNGSSTSGGHNDAPGGGGGGGAIRLNIQGTISSVSVSAKGGNGGSQLIASAENEGPGGGGGGGGGGYISVPGTPAITVIITGGNNGTTTSTALTEFLPNGATKGGAGTSLTNQAFVAAPALTCFALPLEFLSFTATLQSNNKVAVNWSTASEMNVDHFEIQISDNQNDWSTVAKKTALNNPTQTNYSQVLSVSSTDFFIRIKSINADGSVQYSMVRSIKTTNSSLQRIYTSKNKLYVEGLPATAREIWIYSANGQLISKEKALQGILFSKDINFFPAGAYYLQITTTTGVLRLKFIKE